jgi:hypothetical protein
MVEHTHSPESDGSLRDARLSSLGSERTALTQPGSQSQAWVSHPGADVEATLQSRPGRPPPKDRQGSEAKTLFRLYPEF